MTGKIGIIGHIGPELDENYRDGMTTKAKLILDAMERSPQETAQELHDAGCSWERSEPFLMADRVILHGVKNIPSKLPFGCDLVK